MTGRENFYSRLVAWMKILLPLTALGLLSTLFLLSRTVDPADSIPFAEIDLKKRARDQGVTNPSFAGVTLGGEGIRFSAEAVRPDPQDDGRLRAIRVSAEIRLNSGTVVTAEAEEGTLDQRRETALLVGGVEIATTTGYELRAQHLTTRFDRLHAETRGPVTGRGPPGELTAGRMILSGGEGEKAAQLLFTDGVKLLYRPPDSEE